MLPLIRLCKEHIGTATGAWEDKNNKWTCWFGPTGTFFELENATTPEEAIVEAVVAITQRLAQLSADLRSIPLTLQ